MHLQEEMDRLQSEFHLQLCSTAEQNLSLQNTLAAKENELRMICAEWERAMMELTTFLIDGSRSLGDASCQIKSISSSFPNVNDWINEHVEKAAKVCFEKEEIILLLQKSLEDAQKTVMEMEQKLHSLKGATIAIMEFQRPEEPSSREESLLSTASNDSAAKKTFPQHKTLCRRGHTTGNQANAPVIVETGYPIISKSNAEVDMINPPVRELKQSATIMKGWLLRSTTIHLLASLPNLKRLIQL